MRPTLSSLRSRPEGAAATARRRWPLRALALGLAVPLSVVPTAQAAPATTVGKLPRIAWNSKSAATPNTATAPQGLQIDSCMRVVTVSTTSSR